VMGSNREIKTLASSRVRIGVMEATGATRVTSPRYRA
jgi:hypothetical protein